MKKRLLSVLLVVCMLMSLVPASVFAAGTELSPDPALSSPKLMEATVSRKSLSAGGTPTDDWLLIVNREKADETQIHLPNAWETEIKIQYKDGSSFDVVHQSKTDYKSVTSVTGSAVSGTGINRAKLPGDATTLYEVTFDGGAAGTYLGGAVVEWPVDDDNPTYEVMTPGHNADHYTAVIVDKQSKVIAVGYVPVGMKVTESDFFKNGGAGLKTPGGTKLTDANVADVGGTELGKNVAAGDTVVFGARYATYKVTVTAGDGAMVFVPDGEREYEAGEEFVYYAYAKPGYTLDSSFTEGRNAHSVTGTDSITVTAAEIPEATYGVTTDSSFADYVKEVSKTTDLHAGDEVQVTLDGAKLATDEKELETGSLIAKYDVGKSVTLDFVKETADGPVYKFIMPAADVELTGTVKDKDVPVFHTVTITDPKLGDGTQTAVPASAIAGTEITVTVTANTGYELKSLSSAQVALTATSKDGVYTFVMPDKNVTINVEYAKIPDAAAYKVTIKTNMDVGTVQYDTTDYSQVAAQIYADKHMDDVIDLAATTFDAAKYNFLYYTDNYGGIYQAGDKMIVKGDMELTAHFAKKDAKLHEVTYENEAGKPIVPTIQVEHGKAAPDLAAPVKEGCTFKYWAKESETTAFDLTNIEANVTLKPIYEENKYTFTFWENDTTKAHTLTDNLFTGKVIAPVAPTAPAGMVFRGWENTVTGKLIQPGDQIEVKDFYKTTEFKAVWAVDAYTIQFIVDGNIVQTGVYASGDDVMVPVAPAKPGHTFKGWEQASTGNILTAVPNAEQDETYTAVYAAQQFTVSFDGSSAVSYDYGAKITLNDALTAAGKTFVGWRSNADGLLYAAKAPFTVTENVGFTSEWTADQVLVRFYADDVVVDFYAGDYKDAVDVPTAPAKPGFQFDHWENKTTHTPVVGSTVSGKANAEYVAVYTADTYTVTFDEKGGSDVADLSASYGKVVQLPAAPTKEGFTFIGWKHIDAPEGLYAAKAEYLVTADAGFEAVWEQKSYTIRFLSDGQPVETKIYKHFETVNVPAAPVKDGYDFVKWVNVDDAAESYGVSSSFTAKQDVTFSAVYAPKTVHVTFNPDNGTATTNMTVDFDSILTLLDTPAPEKAGMVFAGWKCDQGGVYTAGFNYLVKTEGSIVFTAQWIPAEKATVQFVNEFTGIQDFLYVKSGIDSTIKAPKAPKAPAGWEFKGWKNMENGEIVAAGSAAVVKVAAGEILQFEAQWEKIEYKLHVQSDNMNGKLNLLTAPTATLALPADAVRLITAGEKLRVSDLVAAEHYVLSEVYYTTKDSNGIITKFPIAPVVAGGKTTYDFTMPAQEAWLYIAAKQNNFVIHENMDANIQSIDVAAPHAANRADAGEQVSFTVSANPGYHVENVKVMAASGEQIHLFRDGDRYFFNMPAEDVTIEAKAAVNQYTVTIQDFKGHVIGTESVAYDGTLDLTAYQNAQLDKKPGYTFEKWVIVVDGAETASVFESAVTHVYEDVTIRAAYTAKPHNVTVKDLDGLKVTLDSLEIKNRDEALYAHNFITEGAIAFATKTDEVVELKVTSQHDYIVTGILVKGKDTGRTVLDVSEEMDNAKPDRIRTYQFQMPDEDVEVTVYTEARPFHVTVEEVNPLGGTYTINGYDADNRLVKQGEDVTVKVQAAPGWYISSYSVSYVNEAGETVYVNRKADGVEMNHLTSPDSTYEEITFVMVSNDVTVHVEYAKTDYTVTAQPAVNGEISVINRSISGAVSQAFAPNVNATVGQLIEIRLDPADGYRPVTNTLKIVDADGNTYAAEYVRHNADDYTYYYQFVMPNVDVKVSCDFEQNVYDVISEQVYVGGQSWIGNTNGNVGSFAMDTEAKVTLVPAEGYRVTVKSANAVDGNDTTKYIYSDFILVDADGNELFNAQKQAKENYLAAHLSTPDTYSPILEVVETVNAAGNTEFTFPMPSYDVYVKTSFEKILYTVDVETTNAANPNGTVTIGIGSRAAATSTSNLTDATIGDKVFVKAAANTGYAISKLYVTDAAGNEVDLHEVGGEKVQDLHQEYPNTNMVSFQMPAKDVTIHVEYVKQHYVVTFKDWNNPELNTQIIDYKQNPDLAAAKVAGKSGYHFVGWLSNDTETAVTTASTNNADFVIVKDTIITAHYEKDTYGIVYNTPANGTISNHTTSAKYQEVCSFTANPDVGFMVDTVKAIFIDEEGLRQEIDLAAAELAVVKGTTPIKYTFDMPACKDGTNVEVVVTFKEQTYDVTTAYEKAEGAIRLNGEDVDAIAADFDSTVTVNVVPAEGYRLTELHYTYHDPAADADRDVDLFAQITDKVAGGNATFQMPADDVVVQAVFTEITYTITDITTDPNGTVEIPNANVDFKDTATVTVTPATGYQIDTFVATYVDANGEDQTITFETVPADWTVGGSFTFVMPSFDVNVEATFTEIEYIANVHLSGEADVQLDGVYTIRKGYDFDHTVTVTVTPAAGWEIKSVSVGSEVLTADPNGNFTFRMPAHDVVIDVVVIKTDYDVNSAILGESEGGSIQLSQISANVGDNVNAKITTNHGFDLVNVTVVADSGKVINIDRIAGNVYYFTMPAEPVTVNAEFVRHEFTVVFKDYDGKVLDTQYIPFEGDAAAPQTPDREGYTFIGWDKAYTNVRNDLVVTAQYQINQHQLDTHTISFAGSGDGDITVVNGKVASYGDNIMVRVNPDAGWRLDRISVITKGGQAVALSLVSTDKAYNENYTFVMPDDDVTIQGIFTMASPSRFTDVRTDDWYFEAVNFVADRGYFRGITNELFGPNVNMNRAMFVTVLGRIAGIAPNAYSRPSGMSDVQDNSYYAPYVVWAVENQIVKGYPDGTFKPEANITREEMTAMMHRFCAYFDLDVRVHNPEWMDRYADANEISKWALEDVRWAVGSGLIHGRSATTIDPLDLSTRAEVAQVIKNLCDKFLYR